MRAARRVRRLEIELGRRTRRFAAREMARDDRRRRSLRERRRRELLAEPSMHACAARPVEREVSDVARERMPEIDGTGLSIAEPARAETRDRFVVGKAREAEQ